MLLRTISYLHYSCITLALPTTSVAEQNQLFALQTEAAQHRQPRYQHIFKQRQPRYLLHQGNIAHVLKVSTIIFGRDVVDVTCARVQQHVDVVDVTCGQAEQHFTYIVDIPTSLL